MRALIQLWLVFVSVTLIGTLTLAEGQTRIEVEYANIDSALTGPASFKGIKQLILKASCVDLDAVKPLPDWIGSLESLEELSLGAEVEAADRQDCNLVTTLPMDLSRLKSLKKLIVDDAFGKAGASSLMKAKMPRSLEILALNRIDLKKLPSWVLGQRKLRRLTLQYGNLSSLPERISVLKDLEHLDLSSKKIQSLPKSIRQMKKLKRLNLANNNLSKKQQAEIQRRLPMVQINFENVWDDGRANE